MITIFFTPVVISKYKNKAPLIMACVCVDFIIGIIQSI